MKKILSLVLVVLTATTLNAQKIEIAAKGGVFFGGNANFAYANIKFNTAGTWGVDLSLKSKAGYVGISWSQAITQGQINDWYGGNYTSYNFDADLHYILGTYRPTFVKESLEGFLTVQLGAVGAFLTDLVDGGRYQNWMFAGAIGGGGSYFFGSGRIGLRIEGRLLLPMSFAGVSFGCGVGTGGASCGTGLSGYAAIAQGDITGGLVIRLGQL